MRKVSAPLARDVVQVLLWFRNESRSGKVARRWALWAGPPSAPAAAALASLLSVIPAFSGAISTAAGGSTLDSHLAAAASPWAGYLVDPDQGVMRLPSHRQQPRARGHRR